MKAVCAAATVTLVTTVNVAKLAKQAFACEPVTHVTRVITRVTESVTREKHTNAAVLHLEKPWFTFSVLSYWLAGTVLPVVQAGAFRGA